VGRQLRQSEKRLDFDKHKPSSNESGARNCVSLQHFGFANPYLHMQWLTIKILKMKAATR
jgi:hypothetical protein